MKKIIHWLIDWVKEHTPLLFIIAGFLTLWKGANIYIAFGAFFMVTAILDKIVHEIGGE